MNDKYKGGSELLGSVQDYQSQPRESEQNQEERIRRLEERVKELEKTVLPIRGKKDYTWFSSR